MRIGKYFPLKLTLLIWIPALLLLPFGRYGRFEAFVITIFFLTVFIIVCIGTIQEFRGKRFILIRRKLRQMNQYKMQKSIDICAIFSLVGIVLLAIDRIYIKGIDYSAGLRVARYAWLHSEVGSTPIGKIANIIIPFYSVALYFTYINFEKITKRTTKFLGIFSGVGVPFIHAILNGGRSNILILLIYLLVLSSIRKAFGLRMIPAFKHKKILITGAALIMFAYVLSVFMSSASLGGYSLLEQLNAQLYSLGGKAPDTGRLSSLLIIILLFFSYAYHGSWILGSYATIYKAVNDGSYTGSFISSITGVFGFVPNTYSSDLWGGAFLNFPGAFYHDYGIVGVFVSAVLLGFLLGYFSVLLCQVQTISIVELLMLITVFSVSYFSGIVYLFGLQYFIFILYAFIVFDIIQKIRFGSIDYSPIVDDDIIYLEDCR